jgi:hypothetical protein
MAFLAAFARLADQSGRCGGSTVRMLVKLLGRASRPDDPLDLLPPDLVLPTRDGVADAWQVYGKGWARETVVAMHMTKSGVLLFRAVREATSRRALSTSEWHVETLDAPVAEHAPVQFACP